MADPPFVGTGCDCDAYDGDHSDRCAIYVQRPSASGRSLSSTEEAAMSGDSHDDGDELCPHGFFAEGCGDCKDAASGRTHACPICGVLSEGGSVCVEHVRIATSGRGTSCRYCGTRATDCPTRAALCCEDCAGDREAHAASGRTTSSNTVNIVVTDTHEYHVTIDLNDPRWSHLREDSDNPDEWVAALDQEAQEPDSDLARLVRGMSVTDAWREVSHGD